MALGSAAAPPLGAHGKEKEEYFGTPRAMISF
jgi:hypothetical protein